MTQTAEHKTCKVCQKAIHGRSDKIFCSTQCKNHYHKVLRFAAKKAAIQINGYLRRNYSIMIEVMGPRISQVKVYRNILEQKKFRFKYHTHLHVNSKGKTFYYVYNLAWMEFSDDEILIVRR